jgi:agmatinase
LRAADPPFIACRARLPEARIVLFGIPFEGTVNLRKGADQGPRDLRISSDSIETYSPVLERDLEDLAIADVGNCELGSGSPREQLARARQEIAGFWKPGLLAVMLGGDHTATLPVIEVLASAIPELRILQLDAHPDLREEFLGERYNYASAMARVMDVVAPERVYQVGMRTGAREEYGRKPPHLYPTHAIHPVAAVRSLVPELARHPLYVTIDVDVLDPSEAPGTGTPEPCGLRTAELIEIIRSLESCSIVGADLVEVAQVFDPSGRTGITASWVLREAILSWWGKP